jgi:G:T/U-mismatch repair DNA glycosylase
MLPPLLDNEVRVVFVGTEPGPDSERIRHYYAGITNSFYEDLQKTGWTEVKYTPSQDTLLLQNHHIGLDDVYNNRQPLVSRLEQYKPLAVCFNSKEAIKRFSNIRIVDQWAGANASRYAQFSWNPIVWALYDSSQRAIGYRQQRINLLKELLLLLNSILP